MSATAQGPATVSQATAKRMGGSSPTRDFLRRFFASRLAVLALAVFVAIVLAAITGPLFLPQNPYDLTQIDIMDGMLPPGSEAMFTDLHYVLGTDNQGRDMLSAIVYGLRISLAVGIGSAVLACSIGTAVGILAAYAGGRLENAVMRIVDLQLSFPAILIALMILAILGAGIGNVILAIVLVEWAAYARTVRGTALAERGREYIEAARGLGLPRHRIVFRHLLPNCLPPIIVILTMQIARAISLEATLSFLGLGVPVTEPSLGLLIANGYQYILAGDYWVSIYPGVALLITIASINIVGDRARTILNPRSLQ